MDYGVRSEENKRKGGKKGEERNIKGGCGGGEESSGD